MSVLQLSDAKAFARITISDDDVMLQNIINGAEAWIANYLGVSLTDPTTFPNGTPPDVILAINQLVSFLYDNREAAIVGSTGTLIKVSPGFYELLDPYRTYVF